MIISAALMGALVLSWLVWDQGWSSKVMGNVSSVASAPPQIHPVSLPAYAAKEYDGRELKLGQILAENEVYTRYFITYKSG
ncbi:MAG: hypothetical protein AAB928_00655, partial [Patescibacteria group bacterium]